MFSSGNSTRVEKKYDFLGLKKAFDVTLNYIYRVTQKLPQICTVLLPILIGKVAYLQYIFALSSGSPSIY